MLNQLSLHAVTPAPAAVRPTPPAMTPALDTLWTAPQLSKVT